MALTNADVIQDAIKTDTIAQLNPKQLGLYKEGVRRGDLQPSPTQQEAIDRIPVPTPKFDSMGTGYDYETAHKYGIKPSPVDGHWQSLVPQTGQVLKGANHPTFDKTVEAERKLGRDIMYDETGKLFSMDRAGLRDDGTEKGAGFLGKRKMTDGSGRVVTDMTISGGFKVNGISQKYPLLVSTLNDTEVEVLMRGGKIPDSIRNKAIEHAKDRMEKGLSPFSAHDETAQKFSPFYAYEELSNDKPKTGGYLGALLRGLGEGISTEFPAMTGRSLQFLGLKKVGKAIVDWSDDVSDKLWGTRPEYEGFARWLYEAGTMIPTSMIPVGLSMSGARIALKLAMKHKILIEAVKARNAAKAISAGGKLSKASWLNRANQAQNLRKVNAAYKLASRDFNRASKAVNWITGTSVGTFFGLSQAQTTKDTMIERIDMLEELGDSEGANALRRKLWWAPLATGAIEGIGETLGARYLSKIFRIRSDWITEKTSREFVKNFLLKMGKTAGMEIATEVGQAGGQAAVEKYAGVRPEARMMAEMVDVIGPTAVMTLLLGGASGAINLPGAAKRVQLNRDVALLGLVKNQEDSNRNMEEASRTSSEGANALSEVKVTTDPKKIKDSRETVDILNKDRDTLVADGKEGLKLDIKKDKMKRDGIKAKLMGRLQQINTTINNLNKTGMSMSDHQLNSIKKTRSDILEVVDEYNSQEAKQVENEANQTVKDLGLKKQESGTKVKPGKEVVVLPDGSEVHINRQGTTEHPDTLEEIGSLSDEDLASMSENDKKVKAGVRYSKWSPNEAGKEPAMGENGLEVQLNDSPKLARLKVYAAKLLGMYSHWSVYPRLKELGLSKDKVLQKDVNKIIKEFDPKYGAKGNRLVRNETDGGLHMKLGTGKATFTYKDLKDETKGPKLIEAVLRARKDNLQGKNNKQLALIDTLVLLETKGLIDNWNDWLYIMSERTAKSDKGNKGVKLESVTMLEEIKILNTFTNYMDIPLVEHISTVNKLAQGKNTKKLTQKDFPYWSEDTIAKINDQILIEVSSKAIMPGTAVSYISSLQQLHDYMVKKAETEGTDMVPLEEMDLDQLTGSLSGFVRAQQVDGKLDNTIMGMLTPVNKYFPRISAYISSAWRVAKNILRTDLVKRGFKSIPVEEAYSMLHAIDIELNVEIKNTPAYNEDKARKAYLNKKNTTTRTAWKNAKKRLVEIHTERIIFGISMVTGIRPYALRQLEWHNIDFNTGNLTINESKYKAQEEIRGVIPPYIMTQLRDYHGHLKEYIEEFDVVGDTGIKMQTSGPLKGVPHLLLVGLSGRKDGKLLLKKEKSKENKVAREHKTVQNDIMEKGHSSLSAGRLGDILQTRLKVAYMEAHGESEANAEKYIEGKRTNVFRHLFVIEHLSKGTMSDNNIALILGHGGNNLVATYRDQIQAKTLMVEKEISKAAYTKRLIEAKVEVMGEYYNKAFESLTNKKGELIGLAGYSIGRDLILVKKDGVYQLYHKELGVFIELTDANITLYSLSTTIQQLKGNLVYKEKKVKALKKKKAAGDTDIDAELQESIDEVTELYGPLEEKLNLMIAMDKKFAKIREKTRKKRKSPAQKALDKRIDDLSKSINHEVDVEVMSGKILDLFKIMQTYEATEEVTLSFNRNALEGIKATIIVKRNKEIDNRTEEYDNKEAGVVDKKHNVAAEADLPKNAFTRKTYERAKKRLMRLAKKYGINIHHIEFVDRKILLEVDDKRKREILKAQNWSEEKINEAIKNKEPIYITGKYEVMASGQVFITLGHGANIETFLEEIAHAFIQQGGTVDGITNDLTLGVEISEEITAKALARAWARDLRMGKTPTITKQATGLAVERPNMIKVLYDLENKEKKGNIPLENSMAEVGVSSTDDVNTPEKAVEVINILNRYTFKPNDKKKGKYVDSTSEDIISRKSVHAIVSGGRRDASTGALDNIVNTIDKDHETLENFAEEMNGQARRNSTLASRITNNPTIKKYGIRFRWIHQVLEFFSTLQSLTEYEYIMAARLEMGGRISISQRHMLRLLKNVKRILNKYKDSKNSHYMDIEKHMWEYIDDKKGSRFDTDVKRLLRTKINAEVDWLQKTEYVYAAINGLNIAIEKASVKIASANEKLASLKKVKKKTSPQKKKATELERNIRELKGEIKGYNQGLQRVMGMLHTMSTSVSGVGVNNINGVELVDEVDGGYRLNFKLNEVLKAWDKEMNIVKEAVKVSDLDTMMNISDDIIPKDVKVLAIQLKRANSKLGDMLLSREIISRDTYWNYHGRYVHYQYLKNLVGPGREFQDTDTEGEGIGEPDIVKQRKKATEEWREGKLKIEDISLAISGGMAQTLDYIAKTDFYSILKKLGGETVLDFTGTEGVKRVGNRYVVKHDLPEGQYELFEKNNLYFTGKGSKIAKMSYVKGPKYYSLWVEPTEVARERSQMIRALAVAEDKKWSPEKIDAAKAYIKSLDDAMKPIDDHLEALGKKQKTPEGVQIDRKFDFIKDFRLITGKGFEKLEGEYLATPLYEDITPITTKAEQSGKTWGTVLTTTSASIVLFKIGKATLNIPTAYRNVISNVLQNNLRGRPLLLCMKDSMKSFQALVTKNPETGEWGHEMIEVIMEDGTKKRVDLWDQFIRDGGGRGLDVSEEVMEQLAEYKYRYEGKSWYEFMKFLGGLSKYYGMIDMMAKYAIYRQLRTTGSLTWLGRESGNYVSGKYAMMDAQKWGMDYSLASVSIKNARKFAIPFITYQYKATSLIAESIIRRPWVMAKYGVLMGVGAGGWSLAREAAQFFMGMDDDEFDKVVKKLAHYIKDEKTFMPLPFKNAQGEVMFIDGSYFMPWGTWWGTIADLSDAEFASVWKKLGVSNPFFTAYTALSSASKGRPALDPYTHKPIWNLTDSAPEKWGKIISYCTNIVTPGMFENMFIPGADKQGAIPLSAKILLSKITGNEVKDKWGRIKGNEHLFRIFGINTVTGNKRQVIAIKKARIKFIRSEANKKLHHPRYKHNPVKRRAIQKRMREQIKEIIAE